MSGEGAAGRTRSEPAAILFVEDEPAVQDLVRDALTAMGHQVWVAGSGAEALAVGDSVRLDLVLLDLTLPDANGLVLCGDLRAKTGAPILVCSASRRRDDVILALRLGADDFVQKPVRIQELRARVEAALARRLAPSSPRQAAPIAPRLVRVGDIAIDEGACRVLVGDQAVPVTPTEYRLLRALAERPGEVVPYSELCRLVLGSDARGTQETLGVHARRLRAKLAARESGGTAIEAIRGFGYRLAYADPECAA